MSRYREIYRAAQLPVFQNRVFHSEQAAKDCAKGDVVLVQDLETGLIFNRAFQPELMEYDADYQNEQAGSTVFQRHLQDVAEIIERHFKAKSLIEVGCGKGYFLEQLQRRDFEITGLDPTYEGTNPAIIKKYFNADIGIRADGIILRHVLEHVQEPVEFLSNIRNSNGGIGKIYIEVPCLDWICQRRAWFDIFYEHVNYFKLQDFYRMFGTIYESGHIFGGQYLYVVADLATIRPPIYEESQLVNLPSDFLHAVDQCAVRLKSDDPASGQGAGSAAIWGGASKGVIFALFMARRGVAVNMVIDINPAKQGSFLGATGIRVGSPDEAMRGLAPGSDLYVMNSNYLNEIKNQTSNQFNYLLVENEDI